MPYSSRAISKTRFMTHLKVMTLPHSKKKAKPMIGAAQMMGKKDYVKARGITTYFKNEKNIISIYKNRSFFYGTAEELRSNFSGKFPFTKNQLTTFCDKPYPKSYYYNSDSFFASDGIITVRNYLFVPLNTILSSQKNPSFEDF